MAGNYLIARRMILYKDPASQHPTYDSLVSGDVFLKFPATCFVIIFYSIFLALPGFTLTREKEIPLFVLLE